MTSAHALLLDAPARADYQHRVERANDEMDNLRSAFGWSIESRDIERALELASSLQPLWLSRGRIQEGMAWFDTVFADDYAASAEVAPAVRARSLADWVVLYASLAIYHIEDAKEALAIARDLNDPALLARALYACGCATVYDADVTRSYFAEAIGFAREVGDRFGSRQCRWRLAGAQIFEGNHDAGIAQLRELLAEAEADHDAMMCATALLILPWALAYRGDTTAAREAAEKGIEYAADLGDVYLGASYIGLMMAHLAAGDVTKATAAADAGWARLSDLSGTASINSLI